MRLESRKRTVSWGTLIAAVGLLIVGSIIGVLVYKNLSQAEPKMPSTTSTTVPPTVVPKSIQVEKGINELAKYRDLIKREKEAYSKGFSDLTNDYNQEYKVKTNVTDVASAQELTIELLRKYRKLIKDLGDVHESQIKEASMNLPRTEERYVLAEWEFSREILDSTFFLMHDLGLFSNMINEGYGIDKSTSDLYILQIDGVITTLEDTSTWLRDQNETYLKIYNATKQESLKEIDEAVQGLDFFKKLLASSIV
ncbi:MAG: hypothetical protein V3T58_05200 [Candidatus Hydrothermarchaeales archaeon]